MQIFMKTSPHQTWGRTLIFDVEPETTVEHLLIQVQDKEGIPPEYQRIILNAAGMMIQLEPGRTLGAYGIGREATLHIQEPRDFRGGRPCPVRDLVGRGWITTRPQTAIDAKAGQLAKAGKLATDKTPFVVVFDPARGGRVEWWRAPSEMPCA